MTTYFISDLHLEDERPDITRAFMAFIDHIRADATALYILGDFFEVWVGDDENTPLQEAIASALAELSAGGCAVYLMHGNRDFLIGDTYAARCGAMLLPDPTVIDLHGTATLLMHGDSLCTDDVAYQKFRTNMRNATWQQAFLVRPLKDRQTTARQLRQLSMMKNQGKPEAIMDVNGEAVVADMVKHDVRQLIHGHTHRPAVHAINSSLTRYVLGDWQPACHYLRVAAGSAPELLMFSP